MDDDLAFEPELFVNRDYVMQTFKVGDLEQKVWCTTAAVTDFDLTGQIVWPASQVLAWFVRNNAEKIVKGKMLIEVGAGCGLVGLIAARSDANHVIMTDGNDVVVEMLYESLDRLDVRGMSGVSVGMLEWGREESLRKLMGKQGNAAAPSVVLGADVFQMSFGSPALLFRTVKWIFGHTMRTRKASWGGVGCLDEFVFYATFAIRPTTSERLIRECALEEGFRIEEIDVDSFLPSTHPAASFSIETIKLMAFRLDESKDWSSLL